MNESPYYWLKSFALNTFSGYLLEEPQLLFEAARTAKGNKFLFRLALKYSLQHDLDTPPEKCLNLSYTAEHPELEAIFVDIWPCPFLSEEPVYLAAIRHKEAQLCRVFRLFYPQEGQLHLNEFHLHEEEPLLSALPRYRTCVDLIFSYTLDAKHQRQQGIQLPDPDEEDPRNTAVH